MSISPVFITVEWVAPNIIFLSGRQNVMGIVKIFRYVRDFFDPRHAM